MPFDLERFERAKFAPRQQTVEVESLAPFFGPDEKPEWTVRGLTSIELHIAVEAQKRQRTKGTVVDAIASSGEQSEAVRKALGLSVDTPADIAMRLEMLVFGSVSPKIDLPHAVKLSEHFPVEFGNLTNIIRLLTGLGADFVKPAAASQPTTA